MDNVTKAKINLYAVLRNLQDLCSLDEESKNLIRGVNLKVGFNVNSVGSAVLEFSNGECKFVRGKGKAGLQLYFVSAEHFNKLIDGENTIPIFYNVFQVGFLLKTFTKLAERLSYYLKPSSEELFNDPEFLKINTILTAYTAFYALCEIGNSDVVGKITAKRIPDGVINCLITGVIGMNITVKNGVMSAAQGLVDNPHAIMEFFDIQIAHEVLQGKTDTFSGLGQGRFQIRGFIPMLENMAKLLNQVKWYLR
ncbi:MAG TPA: hypothetical protein P5161_05270 [Eubacteriales bacterium]|jgi:hypothetical protein|nr:hypothetical protein [Clostridia bacterium]HRR90169.1 hypothetical protein [Eubacteriales bacterium]HRU83761.1 hypothetical protein [Eubacteriales bacterium]